MPVLMCRHDVDGRLVIVLHDPEVPRVFGRARRIEDQRAGTRALRLALATSGMTQQRATISISHTEGSAAALVGAGGRMTGVDLVVVARVTERHASAVLTRRDWAALDAIPPPLRPALGWAMKEAAAKATGAAQHYFPTRIHLLATRAPGLPGAQLADATRTTFDGDWLLFGGLLCATVVENVALRS